MWHCCWVNGSSARSSRPRRLIDLEWRHNSCLKWQPVAHQHSITSQKTWSFNLCLCNKLTLICVQLVAQYCTHWATRRPTQSKCLCLCLGILYDTICCCEWWWTAQVCLMFGKAHRILLAFSCGSPCEDTDPVLNKWGSAQHSISLHTAVSFVLMNTVNMKCVMTARSAANPELFQLTNFCTTDKQLCGKVELNWMPWK